jgi:hypothetical protein
MAECTIRMADSLFLSQVDDAVLAEDFKNRPIDADSCRNRAGLESAKFSFEFNSTNFGRLGEAVFRGARKKCAENSMCLDAPSG